MLKRTNTYPHQVMLKNNDNLYQHIEIVFVILQLLINFTFSLLRNDIQRKSSTSMAYHIT